MKQMTKLEAVKKLSTFDHAFLTPEGVTALIEPFGHDPKEFVHKFKDNRSDFKGLYIPDAEEGDVVEGADASDLSAQLCEKENVKYSFMHGRGSRLRECCRALNEHLQK